MARATPASVAWTPGLQHKHPHGKAEEQIGRGSVHPQAVENNKPGKRNARQAQPDEREVGGIENGDDDNGAKVIKGGQREQEHFQRQRHAGADEGQRAKRKGNVGCRRNGPARNGFRIAPVEESIDQGRRHHAAKRCHGGQDDLLARRQVALQNLALDFQPHEKEENGHEAVIDPVDQGLVQADAADVNRDRQFQEVVIGFGKADVGQTRVRQRRPAPGQGPPWPHD